MSNEYPAVDVVFVVVVAAADVHIAVAEGEVIHV